MTVRIVHFADAHIDMENHGRIDPDALLPVRVTDYLKSLDAIVNAAIEGPADLVIFAGDAYKDRNPHPTFQREWGQRVMRLSQAGIATILLVGNHDVSPAAGRAHTLTEYATLQVPHVFVADRIRCFGPEQLGVPIQVIAIPWIPRSHLLTKSEISGQSLDDVYLTLEERVTDAVRNLLDELDPDLPAVLTAHANVAGARYGSERTVMLGNELVLSKALVCDSRLDYVALGHIHRHQNLNEGQRPPVVYPGSIERIDFGEAKEQKGFVWVDLDKGKAAWRFVPLKTRPFVDLFVSLVDAEDPTAAILAQLPPAERLEGARVRLKISYPAEREALIDDNAILQALEPAFDVSISRDRLTDLRSRLGDIAAVETLSPEQLLELYWKSIDKESEEAAELQQLGRRIIQAVDQLIEPEPAANEVP